MAFVLVLSLAAQGQDDFEESRIVRQVLVADGRDALQLEVLADGRVLFIELAGRVRIYLPESGRTVEAGRLPVSAHHEVGLLGLACAPDFPKTGHVYFFYCPERDPDSLQLTRAVLRENRLDPVSEKVLLRFKTDPLAHHLAGDLRFGPDGCLWLSTGDNSPWLREPETDPRPDRAPWDALRTSGNTDDLRGKILRIRPEPDGTYSIPGGNLFPGGAGGRPEIYAMGCRNPFRFSIDARTGWLYWGDVGPNTLAKYGSEGYDEINQTRGPGNYGWPLFTGPNEAYRRYDFNGGEPGEKYDPRQPLNESPRNTGARTLPPAIAPWIWYPSGDSKEFPELGNGSRSAMAGPVYHFDAALASGMKLPPRYDGAVFIYDWGRNWIKAVHPDAQGNVARIEPFLAGHALRKPIDLELGPDGTLYLIEYGDRWKENEDSRITKIGYVRGNRAPAAAVEAAPLAGRAPLAVRFSAARSADPDPGDALRFRWEFGATRAGADGPEAAFTYEHPGVYTAWVEVSDRQGVSSRAAVEIRVGNAPPTVEFVEPPQGGFFDWEQEIRYRVRVEDAEDGRTDDESILPGLVVIRTAYDARSGRGVHPGLEAVRQTTCFSCHKLDEKAVGPAFREVALKYRSDPGSRATLTDKILAGGKGVWGDVPMIPHPQHTAEQIRVMLDWVFLLADDAAEGRYLGTQGAIRAIPQPQFADQDSGTYSITATYTDRGVEPAGKLTGEAVLILHPRRLRAAVAEAVRGARIIEVFEGGKRNVAQFRDGQALVFRNVNLAGIRSMTVQAAAPDGRGGRLELRSGSPEGPLLADVAVAPTGAWHQWKTVEGKLRPSEGAVDLYLVARGGEGDLFNVDWIEFRAR